MQIEMGKKYVVAVEKTGMGSDNSSLFSNGIVISEKKIEELIEEGKLQEYHSEWIPVTEKLPEPETEVLASFDNGEVCSLWQKWSQDGELDYYDWDGTVEKTVEAWMPLPVSYKVAD